VVPKHGAQTDSRRIRLAVHASHRHGQNDALAFADSKPEHSLVESVNLSAPTVEGAVAQFENAGGQRHVFFEQGAEVLDLDIRFIGHGHGLLRCGAQQRQLAQVAQKLFQLGAGAVVGNCGSGRCFEVHE
jgi:hypothetical protein